MYRIIRYFNQNREKVIYMAVVVLFGFGVLQFFNKMAIKNNDYSNKNIQQNQSAEDIFYNNVNTDSAIGESGGSASYKDETEQIIEFIESCNKGETTKAYDMLSKECKERVYPTLETFIENYYKNNFETNKSYNIQRWAGLIYKVDLKENALHTGKLTTESKQDFMTVVYVGDDYKLNINNYIKRTKINISKNIGNLSINVVSSDTFMDYETYTLEIKNTGKNDIYLDDLQNTSAIYLVDENNMKHTAYTHELSKEALHIYPYAKKTIKITFSNRYISSRKISKIVFENVIMGESKYESTNVSINIK